MGDVELGHGLRHQLLVEMNFSLGRWQVTENNINITNCPLNLLLLSDTYSPTPPGHVMASSKSVFLLILNCLGLLGALLGHFGADGFGLILAIWTLCCLWLARNELGLILNPKEDCYKLYRIVHWFAHPMDLTFSPLETLMLKNLLRKCQE